MTTRRTATGSAARRFGAALAVVVLAAIVMAAPLAHSAPSDGDVEQRVQAILSKMTLEQKVDMIGGFEDFYVRAYPDLGVPALRMADGPLGVRNADPPSTLMAGGISLAASWDPALAEQEGTQIGRDARSRGVHFMLGPAFNIYRAPMDGRNFEYMGEDPYLAGKIAVGYIEGMQSQGVSSTAKHFVANNSEFDRHNTDSIVDERTLREIYLPAFEAAVKEANVRAVMDSYNLTNGTHMTQNGPLNIDLLKKEWGFTGILMSDWTSTYDAVAAANGGLDIEMPSGLHMNREQLLPAIQKSLVSVAAIDDKVRRILRVAIEFGWLDREQEDRGISRYNREGDQVALQAAREGAVLLKNDGNLLPLKKDEVKSVLVVGPDAYPAVPVGGGSARAVPFQAVSFLQGVSDYVGNAANVLYSPGLLTVPQMADHTSYSTAASGGKPGLQAEYFTNPDLQGKP
ncbi:MAG: glycoside hydrolase family 3 protein, partial [Candidatus Acidiferrales bacterium]